MQPENVNPQNFKVEEIIYNRGNFSIAIGVWTEDNMSRYAMRWNEKDSNPEDKGYPSVFQYPMWFQLPYEIEDVLQVLTNHVNSNN